MNRKGTIPRYALLEVGYGGSEVGCDRWGQLWGHLVKVSLQNSICSVAFLQHFDRLSVHQIP